MTNGLSKDIRCHVWPYSIFCAYRSPDQKSNHRVRWVVSLVIVDEHEKRL